MPRKREVNAEITEEKEIESPSALYLSSLTPLELMAYKMGVFLPAGPFH